MNARSTITGRHVATFFALFFGTIFAVNVLMASFASGSWSGLIAKNGYVASKDLAVMQRAERRARADGWRLHARVEGRRLLVEHEGAPADAMLEAVALRPVDERLDRAINLTTDQNGTFRSSAPLPDGNWTIVVSLTTAVAALERRIALGGAAQ